MATFVQRPSGNWRAVIRRKARYVADTFRRKCDVDSWALEMERRIDRGQEVVRAARPRGHRTLADLIDLHIDDMREVRKPLRRSKAYTLELLRQKLGPIPFDRLGRDMLVDYGRRRAKEGAGPVTVSAELSYINTIVTHAAAVHGMVISKEPIELARVALRRLGLIGKGRERDRRPTQAELDSLIAHLDGNPPSTHIPKPPIPNLAGQLKTRPSAYDWRPGWICRHPKSGSNVLVSSRSS